MTKTEFDARSIWSVEEVAGLRDWRKDNCPEWQEPGIPEFVNIPGTDMYVQKLTYLCDGSVLLCGLPYTEENRPKDSVWYFRRPIDVMSWAYCRKMPFRVTLRHNAVESCGFEIAEVEVYIRLNCVDESERWKITPKKGTGLRVKFDPLGIFSVRFDKEGYLHIKSAEFHKGDIWCVTCDGVDTMVESTNGFM